MCVRAQHVREYACVCFLGRLASMLGSWRTWYLPLLGWEVGRTHLTQCLNHQPPNHPHINARYIFIASITRSDAYVCLLLTSIQPVTIHTPLLTTIHVGLHGLLMYVTSSSKQGHKAYPDTDESAYKVCFHVRLGSMLWKMRSISKYLDKRE